MLTASRSVRDSDPSFDPNLLDDQVISDEENFGSFAVNRESMTLKSNPTARVLRVSKPQVGIMDNISEASDDLETEESRLNGKQFNLPSQFNRTRTLSQSTVVVEEDFNRRTSLIELQTPKSRPPAVPLIIPSKATAIKRAPSGLPPAPPVRRAPVGDHHIQVANGRKSTALLPSIPSSPGKRDRHLDEVSVKPSSPHKFSYIPTPNKHVTGLRESAAYDPVRVVEGRLSDGDSDKELTKSSMRQMSDEEHDPEEVREMSDEEHDPEEVREMSDEEHDPEEVKEGSDEEHDPEEVKEMSDEEHDPEEVKEMSDEEHDPEEVKEGSDEEHDPEEMKEKVSDGEAEEAEKRIEGERKRLTEEAERMKLIQEAEKKRIEEKRKRLAEEAERKRLEEAERKRLEEAERKRLLEEAEQKRLAEEAERKRLAEEAERKRLAEEAERKRLAEEAERKRLAEEAEKKRLAEEAEKKRLAEEAERKRLAEEAEKKRLAEEAEKKRLAEEAERKRLAEEAERKRLAEEAERKRLAEEAERKRLAEEAERKRLLEEAERKRIEEEQRVEAERKRLAEEAEKKRLAEEARKREEEAERKRIEEEEAERKRVEEEKHAAEEAERKRREEEEVRKFYKESVKIQQVNKAQQEVNKEKEKKEKEEEKKKEMQKELEARNQAKEEAEEQSKTAIQEMNEKLARMKEQKRLLEEEDAQEESSDDELSNGSYDPEGSVELNEVENNEEESDKESHGTHDPQEPVEPELPACVSAGTEESISPVENPEAVSDEDHDPNSAIYSRNEVGSKDGVNLNSLQNLRSFSFVASSTVEEQKVSHPNMEVEQAPSVQPAPAVARAAQIPPVLSMDHTQPAQSVSPPQPIQESPHLPEHEYGDETDLEIPPFEIESEEEEEEPSKCVLFILLCRQRLFPGLFHKEKTDVIWILFVYKSLRIRA